ncbi:hypothetical protein TIFTF001_016019 [Ficus carica]|uniref:Uncharacterized protein n=1 Tax=Ficus carica TaxID=3494 RepID=A0AA88A6Q0_FICCA|nr:hypothetical protein TIFTF001_016019 [Ficus carica]
MSSLGTSKGILEIAKFGVYVTIPIVLMYNFANNRENLQKFMGNDYMSSFIGQKKHSDKGVYRNKAKPWLNKDTRRSNFGIPWHDNFERLWFITLYENYSEPKDRSYIVYPPEAPRPPSPEELREMARELARKRNGQ